MKIYKVKKTFNSPRIGMRFAGTIIPEILYKTLSDRDKENMEEVAPNPNFSVFQYGLIFKSKEYPHPEPAPEDSYEEMKCKLLNEVDNSCPGDIKEEEC